MENLKNILFALMWFAILGGAFGAALAIASKAFEVKVDPKVPKIREQLPGANCGGCGYAGCDALAEAIAKGRGKAVRPGVVGGDEIAAAIAEVMGVAAEKPVRRRAQVMCSGTSEFAKKKYVYEGAPDCLAASKLGGGTSSVPTAA